SGVETVTGGAGDDVLTVTTNDISEIDGGAGQDAVLLTSDQGNTVTLSGVETVTGGAGDDVLSIIDDTSAVLSGGLGSDTLVGGVGDDTLVGGEGSDVLIGGAGEELPGVGQDVAVFEGSKGVYEFGVDADGALTVTSQATGSVDVVRGIETLQFDDGPVLISKPPDVHVVSFDIPTDEEFAGFADAVELDVTIASGGLASSVSFTVSITPDVATSVSFAEIIKTQFEAEVGASGPVFVEVEQAETGGGAELVLRSTAGDITTNIEFVTSAPGVPSGENSVFVGPLEGFLPGGSFELQLQGLPASVTLSHAISEESSADLGDSLAAAIVALTDDEGASLGLSAEVVVVGSETGLLLQFPEGVLEASAALTYREEIPTNQGLVTHPYTLSGTDGVDDVIVVNASEDFVLEGATGADTLVGGVGDDTLVGGEGDDVFVEGGGADVIEGGAGQDTLDLSVSASGITADLSEGIVIDGTGSVDLVSSIETVIGSGFADTLVGSSSSDTLVGGGGTDVLDGGAGDDALEVDASSGGTVEGGEGDDVLQLTGSSSDVTVSGVETVTGGAGD
ncbi:MAG: hypothetical protein VW333_14285, partial [Pseudomonadales bacterium]